MNKKKKKKKKKNNIHFYQLKILIDPTTQVLNSTHCVRCTKSHTYLSCIKK